MFCIVWVGRGSILGATLVVVFSAVCAEATSRMSPLTGSWSSAARGHTRPARASPSSMPHLFSSSQQLVRFSSVSLVVRWPLAQNNVWLVSRWKVLQSMLPALIREWKTQRHLPAVPRRGHALVKGWCENPSATAVRCRQGPPVLRRTTAARSSFTLPTQGNPRLVPVVNFQAPLLVPRWNQMDVHVAEPRVTLRIWSKALSTTGAVTSCAAKYQGNIAAKVGASEARGPTLRSASRESLFATGPQCRGWREVDPLPRGGKHVWQKRYARGSGFELCQQTVSPSGGHAACVLIGSVSTRPRRVCTPSTCKGQR